MHVALLLVSAANGKPSPVETESLRQAVGLLGVLVAGLAIGFLVLVALVLAARRRRVTERRPSKPGPVRDAWSEAGRRAEPYE